MRTKRLQPGSTLPLGPGATLRSAGLRQRQLHDGIRSEPTAEHAIACTLVGDLNASFKAQGTLAASRGNETVFGNSESHLFIVLHKFRTNNEAARSQTT